MKKFLTVLLLLSTVLGFGQTVDTDWPCYSGPHGNLTANTNLKIGKSGSRYRLVWMSEDAVPAMRAQSKRYSGDGGQGQYLGAGGATAPIVAEGKVFQHYSIPNGDKWDAGEFALKDDSGLFKPRYWCIATDEYMVAIDTATGKTVWRTVLPLAGYNFYDSKGPFSGSPCYGGGKVFMLTTGGEVVAMNAQTGAVLWKKAAGGFYSNIQGRKANDLITLDLQGGYGRATANSLFYIWDKVVVPIYSTTDQVPLDLRVFNAADGTLAYTLPTTLGFRANVSKFRHNGNNYLLAPYQNGVKAYDSTGATIWSIPASTGMGVQSSTYAGMDPATGKYYAVFYRTAGTSYSIAGFELNNTAPIEKWAYPNIKLIADEADKIVPTNDGHFVVMGKSAFYKIKMSDGTISDSVNITDVKGITFLSVYKDLAFRENDASHSDINVGIWPLNPMGSSTGFAPTEVKNTGGYVKPASIPFVNGRFYRRTGWGIACYSMIEDTVTSFDVTLDYPKSNFASTSYVGEPIVKLAGESVEASGTAIGNVVKIECFVNGTKIGEKTAAPYTFTLTNLQPGTHDIYYVAHDPSGRTKKSNNRLVLVRELAYVKQRLAEIYMTVGKSRYIYPEAYDNKGDRLPPYLETFVHTVSDGGTYVQGRKFLPNKAGTFIGRSTLTLGGVTKYDSVTYIVTRRDPKLKFNSIPNQFLTLSSYVKLQASNSVGAPIYFSVTGPATLSHDTVFFTGAGAISVKAYTVQDSANIASEITRNFSTIAQFGFTVDVSPNTVEVIDFNAQRFTVVAKDAVGGVLATQPNFVWSTPAGNTVTNDGFFFANTLGTTKVYCTGTLNGLSHTDSAVVTVTPFKRFVSFSFGNSNFSTSELAGPNPVKYWNSISGNTTNFGFDNNGQLVVMNLNATGFSDNKTNGVMGGTTGDFRLMKNSRTRKTAGDIVMNFTGMPANLTANPYEVYAIWKNYQNLDKTVSFSAAGQTYYMRQNSAAWDTNYVLSTATSASSTVMGANYVKFDNLTGSSFSLTINSTSGTTPYHGINGLQFAFTETNPPTKQPQNLTFAAPPSPFKLGNSHDFEGYVVSGTQVFYYLISGNASLVGSTITPNDTGWVTVRMYNPGNAFWQPAEKTSTFYVSDAVTKVELPSEDNQYSEPLIYPVPFSDVLNVSFEGKGNVYIFDMAGRAVYADVISGGQADKLINTSALKSGSYLLMIVGEKSTFRKKIIKF